MSTEIEVEAQPDHLDSLANAKPVNALAESLWNSFDADASVVEVEVEENGLGNVEEIVVKDNGLGIPFDDANECFRKLGGSWEEGSDAHSR